MPAPNQPYAHDQYSMKTGKKSVSAGRRFEGSLPRQRGAALLIFLLLLVMAGLTYFVSSLTPEGLEARRAQKGQEALTQAREALIGYATTYPDKKLDRMYGYLPMPDIGKRGTTQDVNCQDATFRPMEGCQAPPSPSGIAKVDGTYLPTIVGRFPWRTLGMPPLRDGQSECLWLIVSSLALNGNATETTIPFNWDTLGYLDIHTANGSSALQSLLANKPHDRPWAIVYAPGPILSGQDRAKKANDDDVTECGGNYDARNYLDPHTLGALGGVRNTLDNTHNASDDPNDFAYRRQNPIKITTDSKIYKSGSNFLPNACTGSDCNLLSNDRGLALNADTIFQSIRKRGFDSSTNALKQPSFLFDVKDMLNKMAACARDQVAAGLSGNAKVGDACSIDLESFGPKGYYRNFRDQAFVATCTGCQVTVDDEDYSLQPPCSGALLFASQRGANQLRFYDDATSTDHRLNPDHYLDGENSPTYDQNRENYKNGGIVFSGPGNLGPIKADRSLPADQARCVVGGKWKSTSECQTKEQDIVRCIPSGPSFTTVSSPLLGANQLAAYNPATRTLTLGREGIESDLGYPAAALYGCAWLADVRTLGSGLHTYFRFQFKKLGTNVGSNGFVFALADATRNSFLSCGAAGSHLAYSGNNGTTPIVNYPKIGIEFDQGYNAGAIENADPTLSGRNDPCGTSGCGGTVGYNSHAAIVYWGHETGGADGVSMGMEDFDDNVHGVPSSPSGSRPPPTNPSATPGIRFINMRGYPDSSYDSRIFHVRVEINQVPFRQLSAARVASGVNLNLSSPGASIDSIALSAGNRVLVNAQTSSAENGLYVWNGASTPMTRASDADSAAEISEATVQVLEGTHAGAAWVQTLAVTVLGTDPQTWQPHVRKFRTETWIEPQPAPPADPLPDTIVALKNITRSMSLLYPTYVSTLSNTATMYPVAGGSCPCSSGQICGIDNICYRPAMQSIQLGFTGSQRTQDQEVLINDFFTTWLP